MNLIQKFFNQWSKNLDILQQSPLSVGNLSLSTQSQTDNRFEPKFLLYTLDDEVVQACINLITTNVLQNIQIKTKYKSQQKTLDVFMQNIEAKKVSEKILNSILGAGGDCFAYFEEKEDKYQLNVQSTYWRGQKRVAFNLNSSDSEIDGKISILKVGLSVEKELTSDKYYHIKSSNTDNDFLGKTPLFFVWQKVLEKKFIEGMNRNLAQNNGKLEGIFTPDINHLSTLNSSQERISYLADLNASIKALTTSSKLLDNYALLPIPIKYQALQVSPDNLKYQDRIEQINYAICTAYQVPSSLINFSKNTDPNLSNSEQYTDNFHKLVLKKYKTILANFWSQVIIDVFGYSQDDFSVHVSEEITDEKIEIREQFRKSIEDCLKLKELGINAKPNLEGLQMLGIEVEKEKVETIESTIVDNMTDKFFTKEILKQKKKYPNIDFNKHLESKEFRKLKSIIHDKLKSQIESLFRKETKSSKYENDEFYKNLIQNIPNLDLSVSDLSKYIQESLNSLFIDYNEYYKTKYSQDTLPIEVKNLIEDIARETINGNSIDYTGVNQTTVTAITNSVVSILTNQNLSLTDYSNLPDKNKKEVWQDLKNKGKDIILNSRVDLISEIIATNSYHQVYAKLSNLDGYSFVGVKTQRDKKVRNSHRINENKYFDSRLKNPWLDVKCRCLYIFESEDWLIEDGFTKLK
jgi:hypothetical protein